VFKNSGSRTDEVILTRTTTVNIHQLLHTFCKPDKNRTKIIADELTFPTDIYALRSVLRLSGYDPKKNLVFAPTIKNRYVDEEKTVDLMDEETGFSLSAVRVIAKTTVRGQT
jgi:kynureninase